MLDSSCQFKADKMHVDVIPIRELSEEIKKRWLSLQSSNLNLSGPCFHPELFISVGKFIPDIFVSLIHQDNELIGLLPFLLNKRTATADSIEFCDNQAIIGSPEQFWNINEILKKSDLKSWRFYGLANFENIKNKGEYEIISSQRADLSDGFEKYLDSPKHRKIFDTDLMRQRRVIERTIGPIRFVPFCKDKEVMHQLLCWKTARHDRDLDWVRLATGLLEHIYYLKDPLFSGVFSALYAGDELLAGNFGIKYQGIMHGWINSFNPDYSKYSLGMLLFYHLLSELRTFQCNILDLGREKTQGYKFYLSNSSLPVIKGCFRLSTYKEKIKSIPWLYHGLLPFVRAVRKT